MTVRRSWTIVGMEGLCDDWGFCEPDAAANAIRAKIAKGEELTEDQIEEIARRFHCRVKWEE